MTVIKVFDTTGIYAVVGDDEGERLYNVILYHLMQGESVVLDFGRVEIITSNFLNYAVGQLYRDFTPDELKLRISKINFPEYLMEIWNIVQEKAKSFYGHNSKTEEL